MQSLDFEPNAEEQLEKLEGDFDKPFSPPLEIRQRMPKDHPLLDTSVDTHQWYDEGDWGATGMARPKEIIVLGYRPKRVLAG